MADDHQKQRRIHLKQNPDNIKVMLDPKNSNQYKEAVHLLTAKVDDRNEYVKNMYETLK